MTTILMFLLGLAGFLLLFRLAHAFDKI